jgi:hypothetical protein
MQAKQKEMFQLQSLRPLSIEPVKIIYAKGTNLKHSNFIIQTLQTSCRKCAKIQQDEKCDGWQL